MVEKVFYWVGRLIAALGGVVPRDPAEVLKVLGNLLRADPAEKARFLEDAYAAWVGGGWAVKGDPSPETRVLLMALEEGTRLVAEQHGWVRPGGAKPRIRVDQENVWRSRIRIVRQAPKPKGEGVFRVGAGGLSDKALWAAAYRVQKGGEVLLVAPSALEGVARKVAQMIARRAAQIDGGNTPTVRTPYGEVRLLHGDRWEDLEALEPRLLAAWKILVAAEEDFDETEGEEEARDWAHQTRMNPALIRDLLGDEVEGVETAYILEDHSLVQEALRRLDEKVGDKEFDVYATSATVRRRGNPWWRRFLGRISTFGELQEAWASFLEVRGKKEIWRVGRLFRPLALLAAAEALIAEVRDPESAVMEAVEEALAEAKRLRRKEKWNRLNPLLFLAPVIRHKVAEFRVREFGVTRISRDEARAVSRYFRLRAKGLEPGEAAKKAGLPAHLREAIEGGQGSYAVSTDYLRDYGLEPGEEPDYDTILLRAKVGELIEEVRTIWGEQGVIFVDHLLSGREVPAAQALTPGLTPSRAEEIVAHLRRELEGWAEA